MNEVLVTTTPALFLDIQDAADFLNLDTSDAELLQLMRGVQEKAEAYTGKSFTERTIQLRLDAVPLDGVVHLPRYPVTAISSVKTLTEAGVETVIATSTYYLADQERLVFTAYPTLERDYGGLLITYTAGWDNTDAATDSAKPPEAVKVGMLKALATIFEHREDFVVGASVAMLPDVSKTYLDTWRSLC